MEMFTDLLIALALDALKLVWDGVWFAMGFSLWYVISGTRKKV